MNKIDLLYGFFIGLAASALGSYFFIVLLTDFTFVSGIQILKAEGKLGKLITLGAIFNLLIFFLLLKYKKDLMARGVILATIILTVYTLCV
jgi:hypothetical protein